MICSSPSCLKRQSIEGIKVVECRGPLLEQRLLYFLCGCYRRSLSTMLPVSRRTSRGSRHNRSRAGSNISSTEAQFQGLHLSATSGSHSASVSPPSRPPEQEFFDSPSFIQATTTTNYLQPEFDPQQPVAAPGDGLDASGSYLHHPSSETWPVTTSLHPSRSALPSFQLDPRPTDYSLRSSFGQESRQTDPYAREDMK